QLGCTPLGLGNRLRTFVRFQTIEFFLKLLDPVVYERDQSTRRAPSGSVGSARNSNY
ncbi:hypothetical protein GW17_00050120, partial [Ensete ventricosum]